MHRSNRDASAVETDWVGCNQKESAVKTITDAHLKSIIRGLSYIALGILIATPGSQSAPATSLTKTSISTHDLRIVDRNGKTRIEITAVGDRGTPAIILRDNKNHPIAMLSSASNGGAAMMLVNPATDQGMLIGFVHGGKKPKFLMFNGTKIENVLGPSAGRAQ